jgi:hypothetical protein
MTQVHLNLPTVLAIVAVVGAAAFAAGQAVSPDSSSSSVSPVAASPAEAPMEMNDPSMQTATSDDLLPPGHPPTSGPGAVAATDLPAGHPSIGALDPMGAQGAAPDEPAAAQTPLEWHAPPRWQLVPNASKFRLATYRIPHAPSDPDDAELSITQAGGSVEANAQRWVGQFDAASQKTAKRSMRKVGTLDVTVVEAQGTYSGGMAKDASSGSGYALLGAIVSTPGMPHFFKLTGPAKTVLAARPEFDQMIGSLELR